MPHGGALPWDDLNLATELPVVDIPMPLLSDSAWTVRCIAVVVLSGVFGRAIISPDNLRLVGFPEAGCTGWRAYETSY